MRIQPREQCRTGRQQPPALNTPRLQGTTQAIPSQHTRRALHTAIRDKRRENRLGDRGLRTLAPRTDRLVIGCPMHLKPSWWIDHQTGTLTVGTDFACKARIGLRHAKGLDRQAVLKQTKDRRLMRAELLQ